MDLFPFYFLLVLSCPCAFGLKGDFQISQYGNALTQAVVEIIGQFQLKGTNTVNFYHASSNYDGKSLERNLDMINEILSQVQSNVIVQLEGYLEFRETNRKRAHNIIFVDSYESFSSFFRLMSPYFFEYQGFYLIVLTTYSHQQYTTMKDIFDWLWSEYIINANIIWLAPQSDNEAIMYTFFPYTSFYCGKAVPIQLNQFRSGKWLRSRSSFFPEKIRNLHGCPLTVATVQSPPFMILRQTSSGTFTDGIDGVLLRVLSQRMNFTVNITQVDDQGSIYINGTSSGELINETHHCYCS